MVHVHRLCTCTIIHAYIMCTCSLKCRMYVYMILYVCENAKPWYILHAMCRTSNRKQGKKFVVVFVPQKAQHCIMRFNVSTICACTCTRGHCGFMNTECNRLV